MNKIIKILVLSFLFSNNVLAKDYRNSFTFFNWWLQDNGFNKYLEKDAKGQLKNNELLLGTWQGLYLFEHRIEKQKRLIVLHYLGS